MGRSHKIDLSGSAPQAKIFLGDRSGYPAISMNLKTESFTYVILLINIKYMQNWMPNLGVSMILIPYKIKIVGGGYIITL